jgi:histidinol-phosphate aminotransferase
MDIALDLNNVLVLRTLSKSYSLAGLRVGYVVGAKPLIEAIYKAKDSYNLDGISQRLALAALSDVKHMKKNVARIQATRRRLSEALTAAGYTVYSSDSNFVWVKPSGITAKQLFDWLRKQRILIRYFSGARTGDFIRITVGTDKEINELIKAIRKLSEKGR